MFFWESEKNVIFRQGYVLGSILDDSGAYTYYI